MSTSLERSVLRVMSGEARGLGPSLLRTTLQVAEPFYASAMTLRNRLYDAGVLQTHALPRPAISIGNLTAGGTGKTPMVRWLAEQLLARGRRPAVLLRGYRKGNATFSDEQQLLQAYLPNAPVVAHPDRRAGAASAVAREPRIELFLLDDAFQHRKVRRAADLVLINAADPFGFGHVHPRGLLREPLKGLRRAHAIILTRCDAVAANELQDIEETVRTFIDRDVPIFRATHELVGLRRAGTPASSTPDESLSELAGRSFFSFSGIGSPRSFHEQLMRSGGWPVGSRAWPDHHVYSETDIAALSREASAAGAELLLTTEKDWVKLSGMPAALTCRPPILRAEVQLRFRRSSDEGALLELIERRVAEPA